MGDTWEWEGGEQLHIFMPPKNSNKQRSTQFSLSMSVIEFGSCATSSPWHNCPVTEWKSTRLFIARPNSPSATVAFTRAALSLICVQSTDVRHIDIEMERARSRVLHMIRPPRVSLLKSLLSRPSSECTKRSTTFSRNCLALSPVPPRPSCFLLCCSACVVKLWDLLGPVCRQIDPACETLTNRNSYVIYIYSFHCVMDQMHLNCFSLVTLVVSSYEIILFAAWMKTVHLKRKRIDILYVTSIILVRCVEDLMHRSDMFSPRRKSYGVVIDWEKHVN